MLKLNLLYLGHLMRRADSLEKTLMWEILREDEKEAMEDISLSRLWEMVKDGEAWRAAVHGVTKSWT